MPAAAHNGRHDAARRAQAHSLALAYPCESPVELAHRRFDYWQREADVWYRCRLAIDAYTVGGAAWMILVYIADSHQTVVPVSAWDRGHRLLARRFALRELEGVGEHTTDVWADGEQALALNRKLARHELQELATVLARINA